MARTPATKPKSKTKGSAEKKPRRKPGPKPQEKRALTVGIRPPKNASKPKLLDLIDAMLVSRQEMQMALHAAQSDLERAKQELEYQGNQIANRDATIRERDQTIVKQRGEIERLIEKLRLAEQKSRDRAEWIADRVLADEDSGQS